MGESFSDDGESKSNGNGCQGYSSVNVQIRVQRRRGIARLVVWSSNDIFITGVLSANPSEQSDLMANVTKRAVRLFKCLMPVGILGARFAAAAAFLPADTKGSLS
jgi:hypothetical protein